MTLTHWILEEDGTPKVCADIQVWTNWVLDVLGRTEAFETVGEYTIMTLFTGLDQNPEDGKPPALWETEVKHKSQGVLHDMWRTYRSKAEAMAGHDEIAARLRK